MSPEASQTLRNMMGVVVDGISKNYLDIHGYKVGGKTGTANLATADAGYKPSAYISSFMGVRMLPGAIASSCTSIVSVPYSSA